MTVFNQMIPPNSRAVPGPWNFRMSISNLLPHRCSSKACRMACSRGKSSYVNLMPTLIGTLYWCGEENRPGLRVTQSGVYWFGQKDYLGFSVIWEKSQWPFWPTRIMMLCLIGVFESSTAVPPVWRQIDLSFSMNLLEEPFSGTFILMTYIYIKNLKKV